MPSSDRDPTNHSFSNAFREAGPYLTLGLELGLTMIAWSVIGYLLDGWLGTLPWLTLAGVAVGMVSVFLQIARASRKSAGPKRDSVGEAASEEGERVRNGS